jgi:hypothetical protein
MSKYILISAERLRNALMEASEDGPAPVDLTQVIIENNAEVVIQEPTPALLAAVGLHVTLNQQAG